MILVASSLDMPLDPALEIIRGSVGVGAAPLCAVLKALKVLIDIIAQCIPVS